MHSYTIFCLAIHQLMDIFFFHRLATVNNALIIYVQFFICTYVFIPLGYTPKSGIAEYNVTPHLSFWGTVRLFSKVAVPFLHCRHQFMRVLISLNPCQHLLLLFDPSYPIGHKVVSHCSFINSITLMTNDIVHFFDVQFFFFN